jgi:hypothetical protein
VRRARFSRVAFAGGAGFDTFRAAFRATFRATFRVTFRVAFRASLAFRAPAGRRAGFLAFFALRRLGFFATRRRLAFAGFWRLPER